MKKIVTLFSVVAFLFIGNVMACDPVPVSDGNTASSQATANSSVSSSISNTVSNVASGGNATGGNATADGGSAIANSSSSGGGGGGKTTLYAYSAPGLAPQVGVESLQLNSVFGGIAVSNSEDYVKDMGRVGLVSKVYEQGLITKDEARNEVNQSLKRLKGSTGPKRLLGVGPVTRGKHLFNLFGLLATDSWREDK